jgi:hypothetical protein
MPNSDTKFVLHTRCVDEYTDEHVGRLGAMTDNGRAITASTFFRRVSLAQVSRDLGYAFGRAEKGVRIAKDYHVRYFCSTWRGKPCYYLVWSAIEHVFLAPADHRSFQNA